MEVILVMVVTMSAKGVGVLEGVGGVFRVVSAVGWEETPGCGDSSGLGFSGGRNGVPTSRVWARGGLWQASLVGRGCEESLGSMGDVGWVTLVHGEARGFRRGERLLQMARIGPTGSECREGLIRWYNCGCEGPWSWSDETRS